MTTTNTPSTATKNELLRELVIATGCVAMLLSGVGALYWIQTRPDEAAAGATVTTAAKAGDYEVPGKLVYFFCSKNDGFCSRQVLDIKIPIKVE